MRTIMIAKCQGCGTIVGAAVLDGMTAEAVYNTRREFEATGDVVTVEEHERVTVSSCKCKDLINSLKAEIAHLKELQTWIVQDEFEFYGYKFLRYKNEEGLFGYSDEKSEEITCGFSSEDLMFAHAETVAREAAEDRACEVYEP